MDVADICAALEKGMTEITLEGVTGDEITWTEDGEPNKAPKAVESKMVLTQQWNNEIEITEKYFNKK